MSSCEFCDHRDRRLGEDSSLQNQFNLFAYNAWLFRKEEEAVVDTAAVINHPIEIPYQIHLEQLILNTLTKEMRSDSTFADIEDIEPLLSDLVYDLSNIISQFLPISEFPCANNRRPESPGVFECVPVGKTTDENGTIVYTLAQIRRASLDTVNVEPNYKLKKGADPYKRYQRACRFVRTAISNFIISIGKASFGTRHLPHFLTQRVLSAVSRSGSLNSAQASQVL